MLFGWIGYSSCPSLAQPNLRALARIEQVFADSSASKGICHRTGLEIVRHLEIACSPRLARKGRIIAHKAPGPFNLADLMSKLERCPD